MRKIKIANGKVITPFKIIPNGTVLVEGNRITAVWEHDIALDDVEIIDAKGLYVSPGFIDIHVHGGGGHDFMDGDGEGFLRIAELHAKYGTTSMVPTTLTSEKAQVIETLNLYEQAQEKHIKGVQLRGPPLVGRSYGM